jgi:putative glycosyltransferase (TIGR04372 family)
MLPFRTAKVKKAFQGLLRRFPRAWRLLSKCRLALRPGNAGAHLALGHALSQQGKHARAIASFLRAAALRPDWADTQLALGQAHSLLGRDEEADKAFSQAIALRPDLLNAHLGLAQTRLRQGQEELAMASYQKALALQPDHLETLLSLGLILSRLGRHAQADAVYQKALALEPDSALAHLRLGMALFAQEKDAKALPCFARAVGLDPRHAVAHQMLGSVLLRLERYEEAIASFQKLRELAPRLVAGYFNLGLAFLGKGQMETALQHFDRALALEPTNMEPYPAIWTLLAAHGHLDVAVRYYRRHRALQRTLAREMHLEEGGNRYLTSTWSYQVGHLTHLDCYVKMGLLGLRPPHQPVLVTSPERIANPCYLGYWGRHVSVVTEPDEVRELAPRLMYLEDFMSINSLEDERSCLFAPVTAATVQRRWEAEGRPPLLTLSQTDDARGRHCLQALGVPKDAWFVCLHVRDPGFRGREKQQCFRNADVNTYRAAIASIAARGGWVIRVGDRGMQPMAPMEHLIDYAHSQAKSDWMDVFLCAGCRFFIGSQSGLSLVPGTFGVPCAMTNWASLGTPPWSGKDLFLPKLCWSEKEKRYLTFAEIVRSPLGYAQLTETFSFQRVQLQDNSAEEINDLVLEMLARLDGTLDYSEVDEALQHQYHQLAQAHGVVANSRMGQAFLRKHASLLGFA